MNTDWLVLGILAVVGGILLIRVLQRIGLVLILIGVLILAGVLGLALLRQSAATQTAAAAATVASAGQTAATVGITAMAVALVVVLVVAVSVILYLLYRLRRAEGRARWLPGPNAYWGQTGRELGAMGNWPSLPYYGQHDYGVPAPPQQIIIIREGEDDDLALPWEWGGWE